MHALPLCTPGAFTFDYRQAMLRDTWAVDAKERSVPLTEPLQLEALLTTDVEVAQWASEGLPGDELSVQNGLLTTRANRWPLCIDPQVSGWVAGWGTYRCCSGLTCCCFGCGGLWRWHNSFKLLDMAGV